MLITTASLLGLYRGYNLAFNKALSNESDGAALHAMLCMEAASDGKNEVYPFLGDLPIVQERAEGAPAKKHNLIPSDFQVDNLDFDRLIGIKQNDVADDKQGLYTTRVMELGEGTRRAIDYCLARRMVAGFTTLKDYTGTTYFADTKPINPGSDVTFDNKGTKKLSAANYETALENIMSRTDAEGVSLNLGSAKTVLVVGSKNRSLGKQILENQLIGGGNSNPNFQASDLKVWSYLDALAADSWFLFAYGQVRKPWIKQVRENFATSMDTNPNSPHVINHGEFLFKIRGRMNIGAGESLMAYGSTGADAA